MRKFLIILLAILLSGMMLAGGVINPTKIGVAKELKKAFPEEIAGFGCWLKLKEPPDFNKIGRVIQQIMEVSDVHILGWTQNSGRQRIKVYIYADKQGYLVTFLDKKTPPAAIIDWGYVNFKEGQITFLTITKVMYDVLTVLGYSDEEIASLMQNVQLADFAHPDANEMILSLISTEPLIKVNPSDYKREEYLHLAIKKGALIYSWSLSFEGVSPSRTCGNCVYNYLYLDSNKYWSDCYRDDFYIKDILNYIWLDENPIIKGFDAYAPHTFHILSTAPNTSCNFGSPALQAKLAVMVIYKYKTK